MSAASGTALVELRGVSVVHGTGSGAVRALDGVNLSIRQGEFVALCGPSGAGKTSLLNLLGLLSRPTDGEVRVGGHETVDLDDAQLAELRGTRFGFVFQRFHLDPARSAFDNVMIGSMYLGLDRAEREKHALAALDAVGLADRVDHRPGELSGGECQRVAIARAVQLDPMMVLADEPTGNLDRKRGDEILNVLEGLHDAGTTVLLVTHDPVAASRADRRIDIVDGRIHADLAQHDGAGQTAMLSSTMWEDRTTPKRGRRGGASRRRVTAAVCADAIAGAFANPARTAVALLAIVVGTAAFVSTSGLVSMARSQVDDRFDVRKAQEVSATVSGALDATSLSRVRGIAGVRSAGVLASLGKAEVATRPGALAVIAEQSRVYAADPDGLVALEGRLAPPVSDIPDGGVVVGIDLARRLELGPLSSGVVIDVDGRPRRVVALFAGRPREPGVLDGVILGERPAGRSQTSQVLVKVQSGAATQVGDQLAVALSPTHPEAATVARPIEIVDVQLQVSDDLRLVSLAVSAVILLLGVIGISAATSMGLLQRIGELGLRRSCGARRGDLRLQVVAETGTVGLLGGLCGAVLGVIVVALGAVVARWHLLLDPATLMLAPALGVVAGLVAGLPPARRAARIQPADALTH